MPHLINILMTLKYKANENYNLQKKNMQRDALVKIEMGPNIFSSTKASIEKYMYKNSEI